MKTLKTENGKKTDQAIVEKACLNCGIPCKSNYCSNACYQKAYRLIKKKGKPPEEIIIGEIWKDVVGWENAYMVSNLGRIKSKHHKEKSTILKTQPHSRGYSTIRGNNFKVTKCKFKVLMVHRLVAMAFHPNPENKRSVNHINGIKTDNRAENLEWVTPKENMIHAVKIGLLKNWCSKLTWDQVKEIRRLRKTTKLSQRKIGKLFSVSKNAVRYIINNETWKE